jgi:hypothetical protein
MAQVSNTGVVTFLPSDVPEPVLHGLSDYSWFTTRLPFEPTKNAHYMLAARRVLAGLLEWGFLPGVTVNVEPCVRKSELAVIPKANADFKAKLRRFAAPEEPDFKPPLFAVSYTVASPEQLAYIEILEKWGLGSQSTRRCDICGGHFSPEHGNQMYCKSHGKHDGAKRKRFRRLHAKNKAAQEDSQV